MNISIANFSFLDLNRNDREYKQKIRLWITLDLTATKITSMKKRNPNPKRETRPK
jgi:hypothetical protein